MKTKLLITLGDCDRRRCLEMAKEQHPLLKNWRVPIEHTHGKTAYIHTINCGHYKGKFKSYTRYEYQPSMRSWGVIQDNGRVLAGLVGKQKFRLELPKAYEFVPDGVHVKIARRSNHDTDYHFDTGEVFKDNAVSLMLKALRINAERRRQVKRKMAMDKRNDRIFQREVKTTRVTLEDSRRAGNCVEGSLAYAERFLGIARQQIIDAGYLFSVPAIRLLKNNEPRAVLAVRAAYMRETTVSI